MGGTLITLQRNSFQWGVWRFFRCPVFRIVKRAMGPLTGEEQQKAAAQEEKPRELKAWSEEKRGIDFFMREDLLPRLKTISY